MHPYPGLVVRYGKVRLKNPIQVFVFLWDFELIGCGTSHTQSKTIKLLDGRLLDDVGESPCRLKRGTAVDVLTSRSVFTIFSPIPNLR